MYLGECPVYTIMMIGRWSSDAFLRYIRKQVKQFSHNVSRRMIRFQFHRHIPDLEPAAPHLDPKQRTHPDNYETRRNIGGNLSRRVSLPAMYLYNWVNRLTAGRRTRLEKSPPIFLLVSELSGLFLCLGSTWDAAGYRSGMWQWNWKQIILRETLWLNCLTCFLVYLRKASLDHSPTIMIVYTGHSPIYISIAAPYLWELVPTCSDLKPKLSSPMVQTASLRAATISTDVTCSILWFFHTANTGVCGIRSVNGDVSRGVYSLHNHDDWEMVQWCLSEIYQKTSRAI